MEDTSSRDIEDSNSCAVNGSESNPPDDSSFQFHEENPEEDYLEDDQGGSPEGGFNQEGDSSESRSGPGPPAKKSRGKQKIRIEFMRNKNRRYSTFSKRKTGLMKKAFELAELTGAEVLLLVASETSHVYTFATDKLKAMIESERGKALIQACLSSNSAPNRRGAPKLEASSSNSPSTTSQPVSVVTSTVAAPANYVVMNDGVLYMPAQMSGEMVPLVPEVLLQLPDGSTETVTQAAQTGLNQT